MGINKRFIASKWYLLVGMLFVGGMIFPSSCPDCLGASNSICCPHCNFPHFLCGCCDQTCCDCGDTCELRGCCQGCNGGVGRWLDHCCGFLTGHREVRIAVGAPAVRFKPQMPPEFLPVPSKPVFSEVNMDYSPEIRNGIEVGPGGKLEFPGGN